MTARRTIQIFNITTLQLLTMAILLPPAAAASGVSMPVAGAPQTQDAAEQLPVRFEQDIRPLLASRCGKCHGAEKQQGGLRLDLRADAFRGGDSDEPGIVPGKSAESRLFQLVTSPDKDLRMPLDAEPLADSEIQMLKRWIDAGADWPETEQPASSRSQMVVTDDDRRHWSFRPLQQVVPPAIEQTTSIRTPIDLFICRTLHDHNLSLTAEADRRTLIRRISFDITGLPPDPEDVAEFIRSEDSRAYEKLVDQLLASQHYGERWARHWLDVARYADSNGQEGDADRPNAWNFRDFVIRSLNDDLPYDTFVRWQLAGDELAPDNPQAIAATGFIVAGNSTMLNVPMEEEKLRNRANELDDMVSTTGQALLGLTLACARCHDHKYDPLPTRDYYRIMRVFNSGDRTEVPLASPAEVTAHRARVAAWQNQFDEVKKHRDDWLKEARRPVADQVRAAKIAQLDATDSEKKQLLENPDGEEAKKLAGRFRKELKIEDADYVAALPDDGKSTWKKLNEAVKDAEAARPDSLPTAFAFADFAAEPRESWFFERGDFMARNERMELGFLTVLTSGKTPQDYWDAARSARRRDDSTQQRRAMAEWITDLDHGAGALLARVIVNRVWQHHFGEGLVRTVSDFGTRGDEPTHPELLEWLTAEFVNSGWSLKHLHRLILNSATYRQGDSGNPAAEQIDPENRWLWHRRPLRLESEILRDAMLHVAGTLNPKMFGPGFKPPIATEAMQARNVKDPYPRNVKDEDENRRRSVYMFHKRVVQYPLMQAFDAPDAQVSCGRRVSTTVAPQALALLNDPFVRLRSQEFADRLLRPSAIDDDALIDQAFQLALARRPTADETADIRSFLIARTADRTSGDQQSARDQQVKSESARELAVTDFCQMMFALNEFIYVD